MPTVQAGLPIAWTDALCPAHAAGQGVAAPSYTTDWIAETGSDDNELRLPTFSPGDRVYCSLQIPHDLYIPASGTLVFRPHVHWTFVSEPTTGRTVIWELRYVVAKFEVAFASSVTPLTADAYTTTGSAEANIHQITSLGNITINAADLGPSMIFICNLGLKDTSTVDASKVGLLSFDFHYQTQPAGTVTEFA
ncbi:MAG: hypothetical protein MUC53_00090 [Candidatus Contendobacter sp.]|jgi:hypothetical protein|nr:hypothetical protein [Candidatus Contendobacter sp.]